MSVLPDDAYLCGLFYNLRLVCFELLAESEDLGSHDFELEEDEIYCALGVSFRNTSFIDPKLLEVTGLSLREIVEPMKEVVKDFKGGTNRQ